ncbi:ABC transporter permease [Clostridium sp. WILCCON 0269]|uniref:ABC transporter permease n=1 Tax=Candidatus Clostridium eludens TaxID=3381663 RepID=A0ABW8SRG2_9CLOT
MLNIIYSEFLKLKKSYVIILTLITSILIPVFQCIISLSDDYSSISDTLRANLIKTYRINIELICFELLYIVFFALIASYIFSREFTDKTINTLYTYPISRTKIFIGKLYTIYILIVFVYFLEFVATYITLYISWGEFPSKNFITTDIKANVYSMLMQFLLIPIPILIGNITKNIIFPVVYGILAAASSTFLLLMGIYMQMSPLILPALPIYYFHIGDPIDFVIVTINAVLIFGMSMFICVYHYKHVDIN